MAKTTKTAAADEPGAVAAIPAVHRVPASKASLAQNRYRFTMPGDDTTVHDVPLLKFIKPSLVFEASEVSEATFVKHLFDTYLPDVFDQFEDSEQLQDFMQGWQAASGITAGESSASLAS